MGRSVTTEQSPTGASDARSNPPARRAKPPALASVAAEAPPLDINYGPLARWVGFHLRLAQTASFQAFAREAQDVDLSPGRFAILTLIGNNPGIGQTALSRANGRDKSTLTPVLDDLVRRGFVSRKRTREDRRAYRLALTPAGEHVLRTLTACAQRHEDNLDRVIGAEERERFIATLRRIMLELG